MVAFPLMYRNARAAFEQVDVNYIYAGRTLGLSEWTIFIKVVIPVAGPGIASGTILTFARALGEYGATSMLAGNILGKTRTMAVAIAAEVSAQNYDGWFLGDCSGGHCLCLYFCNQHHNHAWHQQDSEVVKWHYQ